MLAIELKASDGPLQKAQALVTDLADSALAVRSLDASCLVFG